LQAHVDGCRSAFSPVRRLPPELLCEIFASCLPSFRDSRREPCVAERALLEISQVCATWRSLILGTPGLW
ncbi:hypothetical protein B0H13DRAFT_1561228, partial [Mycena leptocephala]